MIAILQPYIPHYREQFFKKLYDSVSHDLFCYENVNTAKRNHFKGASVKVKLVRSLIKHPFLLYNPFAFRKYNTLVLMLNFTHLTTWLILMTKFIHRKKIVLWGHGISVKRYVKEEQNPDFFLKCMIAMADCVWLYTEKEAEIWRRKFPHKNIISLNNTISDVRSVLETASDRKLALKKQYGINQEKVFIYCARFNEPARRTDMLESVIKSLDEHRFAFIIIGEGNLKPDFSVYHNVYDFGAVYDRQKKDELFAIADTYIQPGWVGLSIVEAMAYGKPVFTFERTRDHLQCVEYAYVADGVTGKIFRLEKELIDFANGASDKVLNEMGQQARNYVSRHLLMEGMVSNAAESLINLQKKK